ncbi:ABC transporter permease [Natronogracilivirga saccharolytica]|uniref:ABC transporter permease n=1 Tax=Natronogracilivirga saccharolytica TaxID=2812953 RepID=A0A8J7RLR9_9BACT|nr:ABC transporter permease [Natronogracilivirga saccharolytica]MBP3192453.1 ABC transporter permease [Natronogracilivirga saccharolytica]
MINKEKLLLIIKREYLSRLKSKVFIVTTVLAPIGMILLLVLPGLIQTLSSDRERQYLVYDETEEVGKRLVEDDTTIYRMSDAGPEELRQQLMRGEIEGYIIIPHEILDGEGRTSFYHDGTAGMTTTSRVRSDLQRIVQDVRLDRLEAPDEVRIVLRESVEIENLTITDTGEEEEDTGFFVFVGIIMGFIIYGAMFAYGAVIMRSVMEEKTSRIVEVIASSVKPFELLMGKVIGVGALGLTQFAIWSAAGAILLTVAGPLIGLFAGSGTEAADASAAGTEAAAFTIPSVGPMLWIGFILFFLLGFLIYSSLFAAVGSAVDQESDSQQLQMPVILLIIIPLLFLVTVSDDPGSNMAVALSMFPFFAPILMPVRMAVISVPLWQLFGTILLMILTFLVLIWISARIYRVGILMYGKKASFRELLIWIRQN